MQKINGALIKNFINKNYNIKKSKIRTSVTLHAIHIDIDDLLPLETIRKSLIEYLNGFNVVYGDIFIDYDDNLKLTDDQVQLIKNIFSNFSTIPHLEEEDSLIIRRLSSDDVFKCFGFNDDDYKWGIYGLIYRSELLEFFNGEKNPGIN